MAAVWGVILDGASTNEAKIYSPHSGALNGGFHEVSTSPNMWGE